MNGMNDEILVQQFLSGELDGEELDAFELRLKQDTSLQKLLVFYKQLESEINALPELPVPNELWSKKIRPALEELAGGDSSFFNRLRDLFNKSVSFVTRPAVAMVAILVLIVGATLLLQHQLLDEPQKPYERALENIQNLRSQFLGEMKVLIAEMNDRKKEMTPEMLAVYEKTLSDIDESIANAERFYRLYPDDSDAIELLFVAYDRKTNLIKQFLYMEM